MPTSKLEKFDCVEMPEVTEKPSLKEFSRTIRRLLTNKILMCNIFSGVFYTLNATPLTNYLAKYLEIQFQTSSGGGAIITGKFFLRNI